MQTKRVNRILSLRFISLTIEFLFRFALTKINERRKINLYRENFAYKNGESEIIEKSSNQNL